MDRNKYLESAYPLQGISAPYSYKKKLMITKDLPDKIDHTAFLVTLALQDCSSDNPFQDLGLSLDIIFQINDIDVEEVKGNIENVFDAFADRLELRNLDLVPSPEAGDLYSFCSVFYRPFNQEIMLQSLLPMS
jgi:hypothetical protein